MAAFNILEPINEALQYLHIHADHEAYGQGWHRFFLRSQDSHVLKPKRTNWKIHVSAQSTEATEELVKLAMAYELPEFKIAGSDLHTRFQHAAENQSGKTAVFWHYEQTASGKPIDWDAFVRDAEQIVERHGGPGPAVQRDRLIPGAKASYYRNETGVNGEKYVPRRDLTQYMRDNGIDSVHAHNLAEVPDPFKHIDLSKPVDIQIGPVLPKVRIPSIEEPSPVPLPGEPPRASANAEPILAEGTGPVVTDKYALEVAGDGTNVVKYRRRGTEDHPTVETVEEVVPSGEKGIGWVETVAKRHEPVAAGTERVLTRAEETVAKNEEGLLKTAKNWATRMAESPSGRIGLIAGGIVAVGAVGYLAMRNKNGDMFKGQDPAPGR